MEEEKQKAYSEIVEILKLIEDEEKIEKLPFEVVELIKRNSDPTYKPEISREIPLEDQNLRTETYVILGWIASKYWGEKIYEVAEENKKTEEFEDVEKTEEVIEETKEVIVYNDIEPESMEPRIALNEEQLPAIVSNVKWYEKIRLQIVKFFKLIFRLHKNEIEEGVN